MNDKQIINTLMNMLFDQWEEFPEVAVAVMINNDIPANVIADYYGRSETAELMQKAKDKNLIG
jgi:hypothetical protein